MTEDEAQNILAATIGQFADDLDTEGFDLTNPESPVAEWKWSGQIRAGTSRTACEVQVSKHFPFVPARVFLPDWPRGVSWHRERDGALCLWTDGGRAGLPWLDAKRLREKAEAWIDADQLNWAGQPPALDLEAYLEADQNPRFVQVDDWESIDGKWLLLQSDQMIARKVAITSVHVDTAAFKKSRALTAGIAVDIGEQHAPIFHWADLAGQLSDSLASDIVAWASQRGEVLVIARYSVGGESGILATAVRIDDQGGPALTGLSAADATIHELALRGGLQRSSYAQKRVVIVGAGAVGSFLADQLARAGVGNLVLYDADFLLPGNLIRHLCRPPLVGWPKSVALKVAIDERQYPGSVEVEAISERLVDLRLATELLDTAHLVIDATGDGAVVHLLLEATKFSSGQGYFLSAAVEGGGQFARVEVVPTPAGEVSLSTAGVGPISTLISGGCGSPVSPTPPSAVVGTAAVAARCALALLRGESIGAGRRESLEPIP